MNDFDQKQLNCFIKFANNSKNIELPTMDYNIYVTPP